MFLLFLLVLPLSCISDQECGQISNALQNDLGNDLGSAETESDGGGNRIIKGKDATAHAFPWQAQLILIDDGREAGMCGGAIISPLYLITASHCVEGTHRRVKEVWLGRHNRDSGGVRYDQAQVFIHPERPGTRDPDTQAHDIALVSLTKAITYSDSISPVCLPDSSSDSPKAGSKVVVSGWGQTNPEKTDNPTFPATLQYVVLDIFPMAKCKELLRPKVKDPRPHADSTFCTLTPEKAFCKQDSGSPLVQRRGEKFVLVGVVSWGSSPCGTTPQVSADVSKDLDWVRKVTGEKGTEQKAGVTASTVATGKTWVWNGGAPGFWKLV